MPPIPPALMHFRSSTGQVYIDAGNFHLPLHPGHPILPDCEVAGKKAGIVYLRISGYHIPITHHGDIVRISSRTGIAEAPPDELTTTGGQHGAGTLTAGGQHTATPQDNHQQPRRISERQKLAIHATVHALTRLLPAADRGNLTILGGAALILRGGTRFTDDVDATAESRVLYTLIEGMKAHPGFVEQSEGYFAHIVRDTQVPVELLAKAGSDAAFIPRIAMGDLVDGHECHVATVQDLLVCKVASYASRRRKIDFWDAEWAIGEITRGQLKFDHKEVDGAVLRDAVQEVKKMWDKEGNQLLDMLKNIG